MIGRTQHERDLAYVHDFQMLVITGERRNPIKPRWFDKVLFWLVKIRLKHLFHMEQPLYRYYSREFQHMLDLMECKDLDTIMKRWVNYEKEGENNTT